MTIGDLAIASGNNRGSAHNDSKLFELNDGTTRSPSKFPFAGNELDLIIPVLNEERRLGATLRAITQEALDSRLALRIIVVDNGCVDATTEVVDRARNSHIPVEMISCRTRGKGAAVRAGILQSTARFVGYIDADLSTPPTAIGSGIDLLSLGWEVVIGSRRCTGAGYSVPQGSLRQLGSFLFRTMGSKVVGPITDTQCGFKLFHSEVAKELFSTTTVTGFAFDVEILAEAWRLNQRIIELPLQWSDDPDSSFRTLIDGLSSFTQLREVRRSYARSQRRSASTR
jgi:glycosyltransferase involved in cell wall biosynthesis